MVNTIAIKKLEISRMIIRIITILAFVGFLPLAIFTPWSSERIVEDYGTYGSAYTVYHFNIYLAIAYVLPVIGLLATNGSVKRYLKRQRAETFLPVQVSPTETVLMAQYSSKNQQTQQIRVVKLRHCVICGQPNDYNAKFCKYCGNQL